MTQAGCILTDIYDIYPSHSGDEWPAVTLREYFIGCIERKRQGTGKAGLDYNAGHSRRLLAWPGARAEKDIAGITWTDVAASHGNTNH